MYGEASPCCGTMPSIFVYAVTSLDNRLVKLAIPVIALTWNEYTKLTFRVFLSFRYDFMRL